MTIEDIIAAAKDGERFTISGYGGIAFYYARSEDMADEDTEWSGMRSLTGMVIMVMVGDDREHVIDPDDVAVIGEDDYCHECGQVGCKGDGR